jgi:hypothetical protein
MDGEEFLTIEELVRLTQREVELLAAIGIERG